MQYPTVINGFDFRELIFLSGTESATDTFKVAKAFGKEHKDVMRKTSKVISSCSPDFAERNFTLCHENNSLMSNDTAHTRSGGFFIARSINVN